MGVPSNWSKVNERTYEHNRLDVQVRIIAASSSTVDTGFDVQIIDHAESDFPNKTRIREVQSSETDAHDLAEEVMHRFDDKYPDAQQDTDTQAKALSLAAVRTALHYLR
jgi:hypothetical protein